MAVDIYVKQSWKKLYLKILMRETCIGFFNIEEFYRHCNFGCFLWIFLNIKPTCCTYQNLPMTFTNILGFCLNFSTSWKSCVKEQWPKKSLFWNFWLNVMIFDLRLKRGWNILWFLKSWEMTDSTKDTQILICFLLLVNKSGAYEVNSQSWTFETNYTQKLHFYDASGHKQPPDNQTYNLDIKCQSNS